MSIKIALLKSGEFIISDIKELISEKSETEKSIVGYLFTNPFIVNIDPKDEILIEEALLTEEAYESDAPKEMEIMFTPWIPFTMDKEIPVRYDWLVTVVSPAKQIQELYEEMINGQDDQSDSTDEQ